MIAGKFAGLSINIFEILGIVSVAAVICVLLLLWGLKSVIHSRNECSVPDLYKKSVMAGLDLLSEKKLAMRKEGVEFDSSIPVGAVIRQVPSAGTIVREGKIIRVWLSQGGEVVFVPNLMGLALRNAELLLRQKQLVLGEVNESYSLAVDKGLVITQNPKPDDSVSRNTLVNVAVSAGPPPESIILMPDFRQKELELAESWALENDLKLSIKEDKESVFPKGIIIAQSPTPDTVITKGFRAAVTVSGRKTNSDGGKKVHKIEYKMAKKGDSGRVKIVLIDKSGEREIFDGVRDPDSKIDLTVPYGGPAKVRIFVNGVLVEEKVKP
jgi:serine/threonine-protein kinase